MASQVGAILRGLLAPAASPAGSDVAGAPDRSQEFGFVYAESIRNLAQQAQVLDSLRTRAGLLIAAANVVTALLAGPTFEARRGVVTLGSGLAIIAFLVSVALALWILWPRKGWNFRFGISDVVDRLDTHPDMDLVALQRKLAVLNEKSYLANEEMLSGLFDRFRWATVALFIEVLLWLTALVSLNIAGMVQL